MVLGSTGLKSAGTTSALDEDAAVFNRHLVRTNAIAIGVGRRESIVDVELKLVERAPQHHPVLREVALAEAMLVFSSDYPHSDADVIDEALPKGLSADLRARIMGRNALRAYPKLQGHMIGDEG